MAATIPLESKLDALISLNINPLIDGVCSLFLTSAELDNEHDRSRRLKILFRKLKDPAYGANPTLISLRRLFRNSFMYLKQNSNLLRHFGHDSGRLQKIDHTCTLERFVDFNFCLLAMMDQETDIDYKFVYLTLAQRGITVYKEYHNILQQFGVKVPTLEKFPGDPDYAESKITVEKERPKDKTAPLSPDDVSAEDVPQGMPLFYYKENGFTQFLRRRLIVLHDGSFQNRPSTIVRYNGKNTQFFMLDDQTTHYIPNKFRITHYPREGFVCPRG